MEYDGINSLDHPSWLCSPSTRLFARKPGQAPLDRRRGDPRTHGAQEAKQSQGANVPKKNSLLVWKFGQIREQGPFSPEPRASCDI